MKKVIIVSTMAFVITISVVWSDKAAGALGLPSAASWQEPAEEGRKGDPLLDALGASSDEEVYDALYNGKSLAELAAEKGADPRRVVDLQLAQLSAQLTERLAAGSLSLGDYMAQRAELEEIVTRSVYGENG